jgi:G:T/U-mismatch repair DNA glycosylase
MYMKKNDIHIEKHQNWYRDVTPMKCLVIGSFPPYNTKWDFPFYFPNSQNRFWSILSQISDKSLNYIKKFEEKDKVKAVEERYQIMKYLKVGVQNIGLEIERKGESANDTRIKILKYQNINLIIKEHPELKKILLTGYSATNSSAKSFIKYLKEKEINNLPKIKDIKAGYVFNISLFNRDIKCVVLNSTSTAARNIGDTTLLNQFTAQLK